MMRNPIYLIIGIFLVLFSLYLSFDLTQDNIFTTGIPFIISGGVGTMLVKSSFSPLIEPAKKKKKR